MVNAWPSSAIPATWTIALNKGVAGAGGGAAQLLGLHVTDVVRLELEAVARTVARASFVRLVKNDLPDRGGGALSRTLRGMAAPGIIAFPGCKRLELLHDIGEPGIFFTHSEWETAEDLEAYRNSAVFADVWPVVKALFAARAEAWRGTGNTA